MNFSKTLLLGALAILAIPLAVALAAGFAPREAEPQVLAPAPVATPAATRTPAPVSRPISSATAVPVSALAMHENPALGCRIGMPPTYRLALSVVDGGNVGHDAYTPRSEAEDRALCQREGQEQSPERVEDLRVVVHGNSAGMSPVAFLSTPNRRMAFTSVEATTLNGHQAAKVVHQPSGDTAYYVISANGRLYELIPFLLEQPTTQPRGWLDQIAASFGTIPFQPSATTPSSPRTLCGQA